MDNKNVFVAIALSMSVLLFWGAFFETPKKDNQNFKQDNQIQSKTENSITPTTNQAPSINQVNVEKKLSREDSINKSSRIKIENENIIGSISLEGGLIDDISFKNHKQIVEGKKILNF
jgi:YidC/Oxa1 family membrane protein insertase